MKNWSFVRIVVVIVAWIFLVFATGVLWLLWRADREPGPDVYIVVHPHWENAFVLALILPPLALLVRWLVLRRRS